MSSGRIKFGVSSAAPVSQGTQPESVGHPAAGRSLSNRLAGRLLILLALGLPFEARLFPLGSLQITTVEGVLYITLIVWGYDVLSTALRKQSGIRDLLATFRGDAMVWAASFWGASLFVSAIAAPSYRAASLKFALRSLSGILAFFATQRIARTPAVRQRVILALIAGALLSAATAVVEAAFPRSGTVWNVFRDTGGFDTFGLPRPSGVFGFPTIGAMYWEAAIPVVIVAPFLDDGRSHRAKRPNALFAILGSGLLIEAILLSATRSGLAGVAVACVALLALGWRTGLMRRLTLGVLGILAASISLAVGVGGAGSLLGQRLLWWRDETWFRAEYVVGRAPSTVHVGETFVVPVTVRNTGTLTWSGTGMRRVRLGYHWERLAVSTRAADFDGIRTDLPASLPPGRTLELLGTARGPDVAGEYRLHWDLVQEGVTWFSDRGNAMTEQQIEVIPAVDGAADVIKTDLATPSASPDPPPRRECWRAAFVLWREHPFFGIGGDNFRRRYQAVLSPAPNGRPYTDTRIHANSLYFETLADLGLVGVAALATLAVAVLGLLRRHWATTRLVGIGCGVGAGTFFVHGAFDYFFEFTPLFGLFWLLSGLTTTFEPKRPSD